jgi:hypothetical protein
MTRNIWIFILILALAAPASAIPVFPAEFSGTVTINGSPAPAGTVITARIGDRDCGSLTLTAPGIFGGETLSDERLIVNGEDTDTGETITFFVDGVAAGTAIYAPGTSTTIALAATRGGTSSGSSGSSSGGSGSTPPTTPSTTPTPTATATEPTESSTPYTGEAATVGQETAAPLTEPTLTFGPVVSATAVQYAGLPFSWFTGLAALAGAATLVRMHRRG